MNEENTKSVLQRNTPYASGYPPMMPPPPRDYFQTRPYPLRTYSLDSFSSYSDMDDSNREISPQQRSYRSRRRNPQNLEHVKHRRTRSGCYTCRQRRVKCDEAHPVCERCRKGKRECTYPDSVPISKQARTTVKSKSLSLDSASSPSDNEADGVVKELLPVIPDTDDCPDESEAKSATTEHSFRDESILDEDSVTSPFTDSAELSTMQFQPTISPVFPTYVNQPVTTRTYSSPRWFALPEEVRTLLFYHKEKLCHYHYAFRSDRNEFFKSTLLEIAINEGNEALLYAVVAFAAYHRTFALEDSGIFNFLSYYDKSIVLLQQSLKRERPKPTTLLAILQLATIEEFLGDWVTLIGHQKACQQIITDLFTPQSILQDDTCRQILRWYIRLELFASTMSGGEFKLGREWFEAGREYHREEARDRPHDRGAKFEEHFAANRLLAADFTMFLKAKARDQITEEQFNSKSIQLVDELGALSRELEVEFSSSNAASSIPRRPSLDHTDITTSHDPNYLYDGELFTMNYVMLDFWTVELMIKQQISQQSPNDLATVAFKIYQMVDAIQQRDRARSGAIIACQAGIGIASLFLPRKQKYINWARRAFAAIEDMGYIYPAAVRERMSVIWGIDVRQSWLPDDESNPAALSNVREFIEYRERVPTATLDVQLRHMSGIFGTLYSDRGVTNNGRY